jgi:hypothetical protein
MRDVWDDVIKWLDISGDTELDSDDWISSAVEVDGGGRAGLFF